jgi:hypothetical protein
MTIAIPAAFYDTENCCSSKLVKAASVSQADPGCCKGSGVRADGKGCCGKCPGMRKDVKAIASSNAD